MAARDYEEDQKNELEALESIYFDELESKFKNEKKMQKLIFLS
jgi:hypothetical protein